ncbi:MAG: hypothetical protein HY700_16845 [Gemmatimonadetes bacterium]|nr:hypothetical protein [Gemmatimonadota bacterium]
MLKPLADASGSKAFYQSANTQIERLVPRLRATVTLVHAAQGSEDELAACLLKSATDGWRTGPVAMLSMVRERISRDLPEVGSNLSALAGGLVRQAFVVLDNSVRCNEVDSSIEAFLKVYQLLRLAALFHPDPTSLRDQIRDRLNQLSDRGSTKVTWLERAMKRPLHLLLSGEEWNTFINELLDWATEPVGYAASFAAYEAGYYQDDLNEDLWDRIRNPYALTSPWTHEALHKVLEESDKNTREPWYDKPHHAAINALRVAVYLRACPPLPLGHRQRIAVTHIARHAACRVSRLDHPRRPEVRAWGVRLENYARSGEW